MVTKDLAYLLRRLQLGAVEAVLPGLYEQAKAENWGYDQFLHVALDTAATTRAERAVERRIRQAGFPSTTKTLDSYDFAAQPGLKQGVILQLATMDFVRHTRARPCHIRQGAPRHPRPTHQTWKQVGALGVH